MENKGTIQKSFGFVFWILLLISIIPAAVGGYYSWQEYQTFGWEKTNVRIVEGGYFNPTGIDTGSITVEYNLGDKTYRHFSPYTFAQTSVLTNDLTEMRKYAFGATIELFYDPFEIPVINAAGANTFKRTRTALKQGFSDDFYVPFIFSGVFLFGALGFRRFSRGLVSGVEKIEQKIADMPKHETEVISAKNISYNEAIEDLVEDKKGRVLLDNTNRSGRIGMVVFFAIVFTIFYFSLIVFMGVTHDELSGFIVIPVIWGLVAAFFVSDSTIIKREGVLQIRRGWLFFIYKKTYMLHTFKKVLVVQNDHALYKKYRSINDRFTFSIYFEGKENVSVFVLGHYDDACKLAQQLAKHLKLDVEC